MVPSLFYRNKVHLAQVFTDYPPVWVAGVIGGIVLGIVQAFLMDFSIEWKSLFTRFMNVPVPVVIGVAYVRELVKSYIEISELEKNDAHQPIVSEEGDWLGYAERAVRLANTLAGEEKTDICIVGPYGSGKTSLLNLIEKQLEKAGNQKFIFVRFNGWGHEKGKVAYKNF